MSNLPQIYCNINLNTGTGDSPQALKREYSRSAAILSDRSKYHVAIVRANFPLSGVWLWNPELQLDLAPSPGQLPTQTVYHVALLFNAPGNVQVKASAPLNLIVTNKYAVVGQNYASGLAVQPNGEYTAVYDYQTIADMFNNAFATAFNSLRTAVTAGGYTFPSTAEAPFMSFSNGLFSITLKEYSAYGSAMQTGNIDVYFSASLLSYMDGYQLMVHNPRPSVTSSIGQYFDFMLTVPTIQDATPTTIITVTQQWSASYVFHALQSILVVANGIGVVQENVDRPLYNTSGASEANNWTSAIIADFTPDLSAIGSFRNPLVYNASSIIPGARFSKILGGGPLLNFELSVFWIDALGRQYPLTTNSNQQAASIKLCFCPDSILEKA